MIAATHENDLVIRALREPASLQALDHAQFDLLLRQARSSHLVGRLAELVQRQDLQGRLPAGLDLHLQGFSRRIRALHAEVRREVDFLRSALGPLGVPVVLLKGAAYLMAGLPAARGRLFTDVDILVPRSALSAVEGQLLLQGWVSTHHSEYDQKYYRQWMHELPPLVHMRRQTALDVHHTISPPVSRWPTDGGLLLAQTRALDAMPDVHVLAPVDMVLHSMVHLLLNEELSHGLRDVSDLDLLLRHFGADDDFWPALQARAGQLGLQRALHHGLWCAQDVLGTPVPPATQAAVAHWGPGSLAGALLKAAWRRGLRSAHPSTADAFTPLALLALYVRAHWLRMPPLMLTRHLTIKALGLHEARKVQKTPA